MPSCNHPGVQLCMSIGLLLQYQLLSYFCVQHCFGVCFVLPLVLEDLHWLVDPQRHVAPGELKRILQQCKGIAIRLGMT